MVPMRSLKLHRHAVVRREKAFFFRNFRIFVVERVFAVVGEMRTAEKRLFIGAADLQKAIPQVDVAGKAHMRVIPHLCARTVGTIRRDKGHRKDNNQNQKQYFFQGLKH